MSDTSLTFNVGDYVVFRSGRPSTIWRVVHVLQFSLIVVDADVAFEHPHRFDLSMFRFPTAEELCISSVEG